MSRRVVIGVNSSVWKQLVAEFPRQLQHVVAISHAAVTNWSFRPDDEVWIFSYSKSEGDNRKLIDALAVGGVRRAVYVSTVSTRVCDVTSCYRYPRVKLAAEADAQQRLGATIAILGLVYSDENRLPGGLSMVTRTSDLARLISEGVAAGDQCKTILIAQSIERPFRSNVERFAYRVYGWLLRACGPYPCILRPLDLALRFIGWRWYGYFRLGNKLWTSSTSS